MKTRVIQIYNSPIVDFAVQKEIYAGDRQYHWQTVYCFKELLDAQNFAEKLAKEDGDASIVISSFGERNETNRA